MATVVDQRQRLVPVSRARLARAVDRALAAIGRPAGVIEIAVVDDAEIRRLNAAHRGILRRTDVLAFPLETPEAGPLLGQLVISAEAAARQARRLRVPLALELELLATHGTLHLAGYDDRDPIEADLMHRREREILGKTPDRLWRGLLQFEQPPNARRRRWRADGEGHQLRSDRALTTDRRRPVRAGRSRRPSKPGHPRSKPVSKRSLP